MKSEKLIDREMTKDQWNMAIAIKQGGDEPYINFQKYWKRRCANKDYLDDFTTYQVLTDYALAIFKREDWYEFHHQMETELFWHKEINIKKINEFFLITINLMQMCYEEKELA